MASSVTLISSFVMGYIIGGVVGYILGTRDDGGNIGGVI